MLREMSLKHRNKVAGRLTFTSAIADERDARHWCISTYGV
jgi:hypothetical protein